MPLLKDITGGLVGSGTAAGTSTGTATLTSQANQGKRTLGGIMINGDGSNLTVLNLYKGTASSANVILAPRTVNSMFIGGPFEADDYIYYEFIRAGTSANINFQLFELMPKKF